MFVDHDISPIGLDVSDGFLEAAQLRVQAGAADLLAYGRGVIPPGVIRQGRVVHGPALVQVLRQALLQPAFGEFTGREAVLAVPEQHCFHQVLRLPHGDDAMAMEQTLGSRLPFSIDAAYWDSQHLFADGHHSLHRALAMPGEVVDEYADILQRAGLRLDGLASPVLAGHRLADQVDGAAARLWIDIGLNETMVAVMDRWGIHQSTVVPAGLRQAAAALQDIVTEGRHLLTYYRYQDPNQTASELALSVVGYGATVTDLPEYLAAHLNLSLIPAPQPRLHHTLSPVHAALAATAMGAALYGRPDFGLVGNDSLHLYP